MIIRPVVSREYTALPNAIFTDQRHAADTRTLFALVLSRPKNWDMRPWWLMKMLSRIGAKPVGRKAIARMFRELMVTGHMARSKQQTRQADGAFGKYVYFVGMPDDVAAAIASSNVAFLPQVPEGTAAEGTAAEGTAAEGTAAEGTAAEGTTIYKRTNLQTKNLKTKASIKAAADCGNAGQTFPHREPGSSAGLSEQSRSGSRRRLVEGPEVVQARIAKRLGPRGWTILMELNARELDELTAMERVGNVDDRILAFLHNRFPAPCSAGAK
jgi:hypothetical protein